MKSSRAPAVAAGLLSLILTGAAHADTGYEAYADVRAASPWYDGVQASIQYQPTAVDGDDLAVWIGLDDNDADNMKWVQGGWGQRHGGSPLVYWEYVDNDGNYDIGDDAAPGDNDRYTVSRNGANVEWTRNGTIYKTMPWSSFNTIVLRKGQYGAEMQPETDRTPGTPASKNTFSGTQVRQAAGNYAAAPLAVQISTAPNGRIEPVPGTPGSFRTWDVRN